MVSVIKKQIRGLADYLEVDYKPKALNLTCNVKVVNDEATGEWKVISTQGKRTPEIIFTSRFPVVLRWNGEKNYPPSIEQKVPTLKNLVRTFVMQYLRGKPGGIHMNKRLLSDVLLYGKMYKYLSYVDKMQGSAGALPNNAPEAIELLTETLKAQIDKGQAYFKEHNAKSSDKFNFSLKDFYNSDKDYVETTENGDNKDEEPSTPAGRPGTECQDDDSILQGQDGDEHETGFDLLLS